MTHPIDWEDCLNKTNRSPELAKDLLHMLRDELPDFKSAIQTAHQNHDTDTLKQHIHKLHGACCYCGVPNLEREIKKLDIMLADKQFDNLDTHINAALKEIDNLITAMDTFSFE